jgi:hypothetical protein
VIGIVENPHWIDSKLACRATVLPDLAKKHRYRYWPLTAVTSENGSFGNAVSGVEIATHTGPPYCAAIASYGRERSWRIIQLMPNLSRS